MKLALVFAFCSLAVKETFGLSKRPPVKIEVRTEVAMVMPKVRKYYGGYGGDLDLTFKVCSAKRKCIKQKEMLQGISQPPKFDKVTTNDFWVYRFHVHDMSYKNFRIPQTTPEKIKWQKIKLAVKTKGSPVETKNFVPLKPFVIYTMRVHKTNA